MKWNLLRKHVLYAVLYGVVKRYIIARFQVCLPYVHLHLTECNNAVGKR